MGMIDIVPQVGDEFELGGYRFKIQAMRRRRISNIRVTREAGSDALRELGTGEPGGVRVEEPAAGSALRHGA